MKIVLRNVEVDGMPRTVTIKDTRISAINTLDQAVVGDHLIDGNGGALLPGLHDHHLHISAIVAARQSVDCETGDGTVQNLIQRIRSVPGTWVRAINYDENIAGPLDRQLIDTWVSDRPVRILHRSGALWMLNSRAVEEIHETLDFSNAVERDDAGVPNGRLWRFDTQLQAANTSDPPDFTSLGKELAAYGITGVTDASPNLDESSVRMLTKARTTGQLPQKIVLLGTDEKVDLPGITSGPRKIVVADHQLPTVEELAATFLMWHDRGRPVAVHVVSAEALVLTLTAFEQVGVMPGDRLEHASVVPIGLESWLAKLGLIVVTQPGFIHNRGDKYCRDIPSAEHPSLYRFATLVNAGTTVVTSSDAPYGPLDPWAVVKSAHERMTSTGAMIGSEERVPAIQALESYWLNPEYLRGAPRRVRVGTTADLCLLNTSLHESLAHFSDNLGQLTMIANDDQLELIRT